jgi:hypothetical protein
VLIGAEGDEVRPSSGVVMTFEVNRTPFMFVRVVFHRCSRPIALCMRIPSFWGKGDRHPKLVLAKDVDISLLKDNLEFFQTQRFL